MIKALNNRHDYMSTPPERNVLIKIQPDELLFCFCVLLEIHVGLSNANP